MSIITTTPPAAPTTQQQLASAVQNQRQRFQALFAQLSSTVTDSGKYVWANPLGMSPQQVFDAWGTDAAELAALSAAAVGLITVATGKTPSVVPAGFTLTSNADGTVTVGIAPASNTGSPTPPTA